MLTRLVSIDVLHRLQQRFTALGRVTVCLCTVEGKPITRPTWGSRYSELIGTSPRGRQTFAESTRACATDIHAHVPSLCHEGMALYAAPIDYHGQRLAVIVVGTRVPQPPPPQRVRAVAARYEIDPDELLAATDEIDPYSGGSPEAIHQFADTLAETIATLYGQADRIQRQLTDLRTVH